MHRGSRREPFPSAGSFAAMVCIGLLGALPAHALEPGTYRCWSYNVSGGGGSCRLAPPIVIHADGTYQESSTRGTYRVAGNRIYFSESTVRGPGLVSGWNQITFEYDYRGWRHTVTYLCQDCASSGQAGPAAPGAGAAGASVWVQVRLQFPAPDGYLGWVNSAHLVPFEQAAVFAASGAAPPPGSATGSAYLEGRQTVVANFRKAIGARDYVVFLDSGRERVPVASLYLPGAPAEQTLAVNASLKHTPSPRARPGSQAPAKLDWEHFAEALGALALALQGLADATQETPTQAPPSARDSPRIGMEVMDVTPEIAQAVGNPGLTGAGVRRVQPDGPADRSGVQAGDIITAVNGVSVSSAQELVRALEHRRSGAPSRLSVYREGPNLTVLVP